MTKNPYEVLGVSESATDEEIKNAYRALAKKYHPDKYIDEGLKEMATAKMQEINEAYDAIRDLRAGKKSGANFGGFTDEQTANSSFAEIRRMINTGAYSEAEAALDRVDSANRNAEWHFLRGCILLRRGWYHDATKYFDTACRMDPYNAEYRNARLQMEKMSTQYAQNGENICGSGSANTGFTACDCCQTLLCADCCCECMGGDLIRCC